MFAMRTAELRRAVWRLEGVDVSQQNLSRWARKNVLRPSVRLGKRGDPADGHRYGPADLLAARLLVRVLAAGVPLARAVAILAMLGEDLPAVVRRRGVELVIDGYRARVEKTGHPARELPSGQLRLPLAGLALSDDELRAAIAA